MSDECQECPWVWRGWITTAYPRPTTAPSVVSAAHAVIVVRGPGEVSIQQVKSSNGTRVFKSRSACAVAASGIALTDGGAPAVLDAGSVVELGSSLLELVSVSASPERSPRAAASPPPPAPEAAVASAEPVRPPTAEPGVPLAVDRLQLPRCDSSPCPAASAGALAATGPPPVDLPSLSPLLLAALDVGAAQAGGEASSRLRLPAAVQPAAAVVSAAAPSDLRLIAQVLQQALAAVRRAVARAEPPAPPKQQDVISLSDSASSSPPRHRGAAAGLFSFRAGASIAAHLARSGAAAVAAVGSATAAAPGKRDRKAAAAKPARISKARQLAVDALAVAPAGSVTTEAGGAKRRRKAAVPQAAVSAGVAAPAPEAESETRPAFELEEQRRGAVADLFPPSAPRPADPITGEAAARPPAAAPGNEGALLPPSRVAGATMAAATGPTLWRLAGAGSRGGGSASRAGGSAARPPAAAGPVSPPADVASLLSQTFLPPPYTQSAYNTELLGGLGWRDRSSSAAPAKEVPQKEGSAARHADQGRGSPPPHGSSSPPRRPAAPRSAALGGGTPPLAIQLALPEPVDQQGAADANYDCDAAMSVRPEQVDGSPLPPAAVDLLRTTSPAGLQALKTAYPDFEAAARYICHQPAERLHAGREGMAAELATPGADSDAAVKRALRFFIDLADALLQSGSPQDEERSRAAGNSENRAPSQVTRGTSGGRLERPLPPMAAGGVDGAGFGGMDAEKRGRLASSAASLPVSPSPALVELMDSSVAGTNQSAAGPLEEAEASQASLGDALHIASMRSPDLVRALADFGVRPGPRAWMVEQLLDAQRGNRDLGGAATESSAPAASPPAAAAPVAEERAAAPIVAHVDLSPAQQLALLIRSRRELHESVLLFETQPLQALADAARSAGISLPVPALRKILSDLGVSVAEARR